MFKKSIGPFQISNEYPFNKKNECFENKEIIEHSIKRIKWSNEHLLLIKKLIDDCRGEQVIYNQILETFPNLNQELSYDAFKKEIKLLKREIGIDQVKEFIESNNQNNLKKILEKEKKELEKSISSEFIDTINNFEIENEIITSKSKDIDDIKKNNNNKKRKLESKINIKKNEDLEKIIKNSETTVSTTTTSTTTSTHNNEAIKITKNYNNKNKKIQSEFIQVKKFQNELLTKMLNFNENLLKQFHYINNNSNDDTSDTYNNNSKQIENEECESIQNYETNTNLPIKYLIIDKNQKKGKNDIIDEKIRVAIPKVKFGNEPILNIISWSLLHNQKLLLKINVLNFDHLEIDDILSNNNSDSNITDNNKPIAIRLESFKINLPLKYLYGNNIIKNENNSFTYFEIPIININN
ncbi:hypothetical protein DICPUDRAFT_74050 [Dictyostelium purpureum]|uniref:Uncharacterized protein n=1 Tax=Dictyostelium purpureum TaxID=5786 RepID=F0Z6S2_DICPU|nr:uncharacterized protein DICPUDRAFT_74050 [Dictyostelium purpureum]EGC40357.1 hypothetical protein DICPUDRAFT_74050 [Dictyostelium purpureum]|eukprot:XP_003283108.1 hypothetical protein DICPUDRAFT_74050 [Dictyostelium purpureum]